MKRLTVCGSTGSIGVSTLDVVLRNRERYDIFALTAHSNVDMLAAGETPTNLVDLDEQY